MLPKGRAGNGSARVSLFPPYVIPNFKQARLLLAGCNDARSVPAVEFARVAEISARHFARPSDAALPAQAKVADVYVCAA